MNVQLKPEELKLVVDALDQRQNALKNGAAEVLPELEAVNTLNNRLKELHENNERGHSLDPMYRILREGEKENLWQGDIISRRKLVYREKALRGHQSYIENRHDLVAFCVVTQTCDLVVSQGGVEFICLAVIRRLTDVLGRESVASKKRKKTSGLLEKIVNHRDNKMGFFFLHRAPQVGIGDDWVVDLRTIFSLVSRLHYQQIRRSRIVSLDEVYANRLGWMIGSMYARVPTEEWKSSERKQSEEQYINQLLEKIGRTPKPYPFEIPFGPSDVTFIGRRQASSRSRIYWP